MPPRWRAGPSPRSGNSAAARRSRSTPPCRLDDTIVTMDSGHLPIYLAESYPFKIIKLPIYIAEIYPFTTYQRSTIKPMSVTWPPTHLVMCCGAMHSASISAPLAEMPSWKLPYVSIRPANFSVAVQDIPRLRLTDCEIKGTGGSRNCDPK